MLEGMAADDHMAGTGLTPEARRAMLRAFADRMLVKIAAMDDPEDLPGVERAVRTAAMIERIYSRCDRAEAHRPDPYKVKAERTRHAADAVRACADLAGALQWSDKRRQDLGKWWDAAETHVQADIQTPAATPQAPAAAKAPHSPAPASRKASSADQAADAILKLCADLSLKASGGP